MNEYDANDLFHQLSQKDSETFVYLPHYDGVENILWFKNSRQTGDPLTFEAKRIASRTSYDSDDVQDKLFGAIFRTSSCYSCFLSLETSAHGLHGIIYSPRPDKKK